MITTARKESEIARAPAKKTSAVRSFPWVFAEVLLSVLLTVLCLETAFALAGVGEEEYLKRDDILGWSPIPGKHITWRREGFSRLAVNKYGMVDIERSLKKQTGTFRIAVLGDSNVESLQVPRDESFCALIEKALGTELKQNVEVLNFGVSAYNSGQFYLRLKNLAWRFHPDLVIAAIAVDSTKKLAPQQGDGFFSARPEFSLSEKGELLFDYRAQERWTSSPAGLRVKATSWLREHSRIWGVVSIAVEQAQNWYEGLKRGYIRWGATVTNKKTAFDTADHDASLYGVFAEPGKHARLEIPHALSHDEQEELMRCWPIHEAIIARMKNECDASRCPMVVLRLPCVNGHDNAPESQLLKSTAARLRVPFIDARDAFVKAMRERDEALFYSVHLSPAGHRVLSDTIVGNLLPLIASKHEDGKDPCRTDALKATDNNKPAQGRLR
ncbi:MAG TPA: SGNH/GDSL hydrolase family protein [Candidatus Obscuribacterales bacterium]